MQEYYYILQSKINSKLADKVMPGESIRLNGYSYVRLNQKPRGRQIVHNLVGQDSNDRFIIY